MWKGKNFVPKIGRSTSFFNLLQSAVSRTTRYIPRRRSVIGSLSCFHPRRAAASPVRWVCVCANAIVRPAPLKIPAKCRPDFFVPFFCLSPPAPRKWATVSSLLPKVHDSPLLYSRWPFFWNGRRRFFIFEKITKSVYYVVGCVLCSM